MYSASGMTGNKNLALPGFLLLNQGLND